MSIRVYARALLIAVRSVWFYIQTVCATQSALEMCIVIGGSSGDVSEVAFGEWRLSVVMASTSK